MFVFVLLLLSFQKKQKGLASWTLPRVHQGFPSHSHWAAIPGMGYPGISRNKVSSSRLATSEFHPIPQALQGGGGARSSLSLRMFPVVPHRPLTSVVLVTTGYWAPSPQLAHSVPGASGHRCCPYHRDSQLASHTAAGPTAAWAFSPRCLHTQHIRACLDLLSHILAESALI